MHGQGMGIGMLFIHFFGKVALALCIILLLKYVSRKFKLKRLNKLLVKTHIKMGYVVIGIGLVHGLFALFKQSQMYFANVTGIILFLLIIGVALTYLKRAKLKSKWFYYHKILAVLTLIMLVVHFLSKVV